MLYKNDPHVASTSQYNCLKIVIPTHPAHIKKGFKLVVIGCISMTMQLNANYHIHSRPVQNQPASEKEKRPQGSPAIVA